jgi:two-component system, OmpR family, sensor histidine kinase KdpD
MLKRLLRPPRGTGPVRTALASLLPPAVATGLGMALRQTAPVTAASAYMLAVVVAAALGGIRGGLGAALLSGLALNFFFTPPKYTVRVEKFEDVVALVVFLVVASIVGSLLARAIEERERASRRERETRLLNYFATKLLSGEPLERMMNDFAAALLEPFGLVRAEIHAGAEGWSFEAAAGSNDDAGPRATVPIVVGKTPFGMLTAVRREGAESLHGAEMGLLESCAKQVAVALERGRLDAQVEGARLDSETSQMRAALFSSVTHDLRTPLASIKAGVTSLLDPAASHDADQERDLLRTVLEETDRLNRLVGNILDLAKVRAGALVPAKEPTAIDEVIESVLHRMAPSLANVRVRTLVRPDLPVVPVDPVQVDQVLTNLLENAARFSPPGGEVLVSASPWQRAIQVRVADQGPGIPLEDRVVVFEALYRRDAGRGRGGSGLGLAIARAIVVAHGGRIWIEGVPSGGTAVVFELPMTDAGPAKEEP